MAYEFGVNRKEQQAKAPADWDDFSVKDVLELRPDPTSRSLRFASLA